ncbi:MAG: hypothetical protein H6752_12425 [Candidatus Omnitrophica bacterium]|nr:hypothetical protein [Candidatus Omnitrophota bacterium]
MNDCPPTDPTDRVPSSERLLSGFALFLILFMFGATLLFIVHHDFFSPDEADVANLTRTATNFSDFNQKYLGGGPLGKLIFYGFLRIFDLGLPGNQSVACLITFLTCLYFLYLARCFGNFRGFALLIPGFAFATSSPAIAFGSWGFYIYAEMILFSAIFLHLLLSLEETPCLDFRRGFVVFSLMAFMVVMVIHCALPAVVLLGVYFLQRVRLRIWGEDQRDGGENFLRVVVGELKIPLLIGIPILALGLGLVLISSSPELGTPRRSLYPLYYPLSDLPKSLEGAASFIATRTIWLFRSVFGIYRAEFIQSLRMEDYKPTFNFGIAFLSLSFVIGTVRSLFLTKSHRFPLALYTILVVAATLTLSLIGKYPYGIVRYLLFLLVPILFLSSLGVRDLLDWAGRLAGLLTGVDRNKKVWRTGITLSFIVVVVPLFYWQGRIAYATAKKAIEYNRDWASELEAIQADQSSGMVWDYYSSNLLNYALPDYTRTDSFKFPRDFMVKNPDPGVTIEEWRDYLNRHETILCLMFNPLERYPDFYEEVTKRFRVTPLPGVRWWYLSRWDRIDPFENRLPSPNDFTTWDKVGDVKIDSESAEQRLILGPGANLYQYVRWTIEPGTEVIGSVTLRADPPTRVGVSVERHGDTPPEGSARKWVQIGPEPTRVEAAYQFTKEHKMIRLRLWAPEESEATFNATEASLRQVQ